MRLTMDSGTFPSTPQLREVVTDIAAALAHIHSQRITHGDFKTANILVVRQGDRWSSKLGDLGCVVEARSASPTHVHELCNLGLGHVGVWPRRRHCLFI